MNKQKSGKHRFTASEVKEFQFLFDFHDSDEDGLVHCSLLGTLLKLAGIILNEKELENKVNAFEMKGGSFDVNDFIELMDSKVKHNLLEEDIEKDYFLQCLESIGDYMGQVEMGRIRKQIKANKQQMVNMTTIFNTLKQK